MTTENVWCLTDERINQIQVESIDRLIARCSAAHFVNIQIRINGKDEVCEADWLKHMKRVVEPADHSQLLKFYNVRTTDELIERLHHHIEKLQSQLPPSGSPAFERVREG